MAETGIPGMGRLESAIMQAVWAAAGWLPIAGIRDQMDYPVYPGVGYSTMATVAGVLHTKGLLDREAGKPGGRGQERWYFRAATGRDEYLAGRVAELLACADDPAAVVAAAVAGGGRG